MFGTLYAKALHWAGHRHAPWYLAALSFADSSFLPMPPGVMLVPMILARPGMTWRYAALVTASSVIGGMFGYAIGHFSFIFIEPMLHRSGYWGDYLEVKGWFSQWGVWLLVAAGFIPIPYKIFTIAAGVLAMAFVPFAAASVVGRSIRFFLTAGLILWTGKRLDQILLRYIDVIAWSVVAAAVIAYVAVHR